MHVCITGASNIIEPRPAMVGCGFVAEAQRKFLKIFSINQCIEMFM